MRRSPPMDRSAFWLIFPPRYTTSFVGLHTWPAASTLNMAVDSGLPIVRKHMISALASGLVRPNAVNTTLIAPVIFLSCSSDCETTPSSSACPKATSPGLAIRWWFPPAPRPFLFPQMHEESVHDGVVRLKVRVGHLYNRREKHFKQEGREHAPLTMALFHGKPP